ncbi:MAG: enoyl-CoA hydratase/isomerase family protein [Chloroflexi bacterium]|nr:enoyl-CoA hydratase/isomerase family protein [Chloroflexota bacterium]
MSVLIYEKRNQVAYITLNRPEALNAFNNEMNEALGKAFSDFRDDPSLLVGIITGAGRAFSAGADLKEMTAMGQAAGTRSLNTPTSLGLWKPLIAAIDGYAMAGGFYLSLECDIRLATERSKLGAAVTRMGTFGGPTLLNLSKMIPVGDALYILLTGDNIDAAEAYRIGLIRKVLPDKESLMKEAEAIAEKIKLCAPLADQAVRRLVYTSMSRSPEETLALAEALRKQLAETEDAREGPRAFAEKRKPVWKMR